MITWIDKKSVLMLADKKKIKAGDVIPAGILSDARIEALKKQKKIKVVVSDVEPGKNEKENKPVQPEKEIPKRGIQGMIGNLRTNPRKSMTDIINDRVRMG